VRVLVFGNINAGKTHVTDVLQQLLPERPLLNIDDYRKKFGDGSFEGEELAQARFISDVVGSNDCIAECTGLGPLGQRLHAAVPHKESIVLHVVASEAVCLGRVHGKDFAATPYPPSEEAIENTIRRCHDEFVRGDLKQLWRDSALWTFPLSGESHSVREEVTALPIAQVQALSSVLAAVRELPDVSALIWFGSGPRRKMSHNSDIDLFLVSSRATADVLARVTESVPQIVFSDQMHNKLTFRFPTEVLVEMTCIETLSDLDEYYPESRFQCPSDSVLLGGAETLRHLESIRGRQTETKTLAADLWRECFYYVLSLGPLSRKGDVYKYYFHNNIVLHNVVRLKALEAGQVEFNYLPLNSRRLLSDEEIDVLTYPMGHDMEEHRRRLIGYMVKFIQTLDVVIDDRERYVSYLSQIEPGT
jgi:hypothetical protein